MFSSPSIPAPLGSMCMTPTKPRKQKLSERRRSAIAKPPPPRPSVGVKAYPVFDLEGQVIGYRPYHHDDRGYLLHFALPGADWLHEPYPTPEAAMQAYEVYMQNLKEEQLKANGNPN